MAMAWRVSSCRESRGGRDEFDEEPAVLIRELKFFDTVAAKWRLEQYFEANHT
jgi:hypothetical protein